MDHAGPLRKVDDLARAHRPRREQIHRPLLLSLPHGCGGSDGAAIAENDPGGRVQSGGVRPSPDARRRAAWRGGPGLEHRAHHPDVRTGRRRLELAGARRRALRAARASGGARAAHAAQRTARLPRSGLPRSHRPALDRRDGDGFLGGAGRRGGPLTGPTAGAAADEQAGRLRVEPTPRRARLRDARLRRHARRR